MRVLASAYSCGPGRGSEPGVGWNWVYQIAQNHQTWVLTTYEFKSDIEEQLQNHPFPSLHFCFFDIPLGRNFFSRFGRIGLEIHYRLWQMLALFTAYHLHQLHHFDLAHHITFGANYLPTFLCLLPVPFVWGPIGGGGVIPKQFRREFSFSGRITEFFRDLIQHVYIWLPSTYIILKKSKLILVRTHDTLDTIPLVFHPKTKIVLETAMDKQIVHNSSLNKQTNHLLKITMVSRLIYWKAHYLGIKAFAKVVEHYGDAKLFLIGEGTEKMRLQKLVSELKLEDKVIFLGQLSRVKTLRHIKTSRILLHPSLRDGGAWGIAEALSYGIPVVCLDIAGPGLMVNDKCGIKVKPRNIDQTIDDLALALQRLILDKELYCKLSSGALKLIRNDLNWDKIKDKINKFYNEASRERH